MTEERRDYMNTFIEANRCISGSKVSCIIVKFSYRDFFNHLKVKWYVRLYRKLFPTRTYIKWRIKQALFSILHKNVILKIDKYLAYGDKIE